MHSWLHWLLKWGLALLYLGVCVVPAFFFPRWVVPMLIALLAVYIFWIYWTLETSVARNLDVRPLTRWDVPDYEHFRQRLAEGCAQVSLKQEPLWAVTESKSPNAMAVGGHKGMVVFTTALLKQHPPDELLAIAGHELRHLADRDSLPAVIGGAWLRLLGLAAFLLRIYPFTAILGVALSAITSAIAWLGATVMGKRSRYNEHMADLTGARLTSPDTMIAALRRLEEAHRYQFGEPFEYPAWSPLWITRRLHASHPKTERRIQFLTGAVERGEFSVS